jgi:hypothetical protein
LDLGERRVRVAVWVDPFDFMLEGLCVSSSKLMISLIWTVGIGRRMDLGEVELALWKCGDSSGEARPEDGLPNSAERRRVVEPPIDELVPVDVWVPVRGRTGEIGCLAPPLLAEERSDCAESDPTMAWLPLIGGREAESPH